MTRHILLAEDDPSSRHLMAALLRQMGYRVTSAEAGDQALEYLESGMAFDLVLSDVVMPAVSGIELAVQSRRAQPDMPVVLMTGFAHAVDDSISSGFVTLCKPIRRDALALVLDDALTEREADSVASKPRKDARLTNAKRAVGEFLRVIDEARDLVAAGVVGDDLADALAHAEALLDRAQAELSGVNRADQGEMHETVSMLRARFKVLQAEFSRPPRRS